MINYSSIKYISSLLNYPETITAGDQSSIALFRQTFPYFVPVRYLAAVENNKVKPWAPAMLSEIHPYLGDWILFCDFLENGNKAWNGEVKPGPVPVNKVLDKKKIEVAPVHADHANEKNEELPATQAIAAATEITEEIPAMVSAPAEEPPVPSSVFEPTDTITTRPTGEEEPQADATDRAVEQHTSVFVQVTELLQESEKPEAEPKQPEAIAEVAAAETAEDIPLENEDLQPVAISDDDIEPMEAVELTATEDEDDTDEPVTIAETEANDPLISPVYTQDYFLQQGEKVSEELPDEIGELIDKEEETDEDKSLMVMMSFSEWLTHFKNTSQKQQEERKDQKALKTMWQKEKLAAAMEEENEEIPENVFRMAVTSITKEEGLASETLAEVYIKQGKYDQAIEMYRKLSLRNPQKSTYFARKIEEILKEK